MSFPNRLFRQHLSPYSKGIGKNFIMYVLCTIFLFFSSRVHCICTFYSTQKKKHKNYFYFYKNHSFDYTLYIKSKPGIDYRSLACGTNALPLNYLVWQLYLKFRPSSVKSRESIGSIILGSWFDSKLDIFRSIENILTRMIISPISLILLK